jgi:hypothetical protein
MNTNERAMKTYEQTTIPKFLKTKTDEETAALLRWRTQG